MSAHRAGIIARGGHQAGARRRPTWRRRALAGVGGGLRWAALMALTPAVLLYAAIVELGS